MSKIHAVLVFLLNAHRANPNKAINTMPMVIIMYVRHSLSTPVNGLQLPNKWKNGAPPKNPSSKFEEAPPKMRIDASSTGREGWRVHSSHRND